MKKETTQSSALRHGFGCTLASVVRGFCLVLCVYLLLSWATLFIYDWSPFPLGYTVVSFLWNTHLPFILLLAVISELALLIRDFLIERTGGIPTESQSGRRTTRISAGVTVALLLVWSLIIVSHQPIINTDGVPHLKPLSTFKMDIMSTRPTIDVQTNEIGFRDRSWADRPQREGGPYRILIVGDSIVFGSGITQQNETITPVLEKTLRQTTGNEFDVFNISINGLNFTQQMAMVERYSEKIKPDLSVIMYNTENDLMPVLPYYENPILSMVFLPGFLSYVYAVDGYMQKHRLFDSPGKKETLQEEMDTLGKLAKERGFDVLFVYLRAHCPPHYHVPSRTASGVFAYAHLGAWNEEADLTFPNDFHPTPKGIRWMARKLTAHIVRVRNEGAMWRNGVKADPITADFERTCLIRTRGPNQ